MEHLIDGLGEELQEQYIIDSDIKAEKALRILHSELDGGDSDSNRLIETCKNAIAEYEESIAKYKERRERRVDYYKGLLRKYFESVPHKVSKTGNESYELPSGKLWMKQKEPDFKRDDEKLVNWLESVSHYLDLIKVKKSPDWAELKKRVNWKNGIVYDEDGQVVEGVEAIERDPEFEVKI